MDNPWNEDTLKSRICSNKKQKKRFAAGSPDEREISTYRSAIPAGTPRHSALVMGMTPELRNMAVKQFDHIYSVDANPESIKLYRDWLDNEYKSKEKVIQGDWFDIDTLLSHKVDVIFGDGIFANLSDEKKHIELLKHFKTMLNKKGCLIVRKVLIPHDLDLSHDQYERLLHRFRNGALNEMEFGFGVRFIGHYDCCYDKDNNILDNKKLFQEMETLFSEGKISSEEKAFIWRYYFGGKNCVLPESRWESLLSENNIRFKVFPCEGQDWYRYYKIYRCEM